MSKISRRTLFTRPVVVAALAVVVVAIGFGAYWFQPWKLFTNTEVDEALPGLPEATSESEPPAGGPTVEPPAGGPTVVSQGDLISHEHETTGLVRLVEEEDGAYVVRIENLDTSNGPDLHVFFTDAPVLPGDDGWKVFDQGRYLDLGPLKGNRGSANYPVPADADITGLTSVSVWCDRFDVSFGAAELVPA